MDQWSSAGESVTQLVLTSAGSRPDDADGGKQSHCCSSSRPLPTPGTSQENCHMSHVCSTVELQLLSSASICKLCCTFFIVKCSG